MIKVLIVDDHKLFRQGLRSLLSRELDIEVVGEAGDGIEAKQMMRELTPEVILMDIRMPRCGGLQATVDIRREFPKANIVILTVSDKDEDLFEAIKAGAIGYLLKSADASELIRSIRGVVVGEASISPVMAPKLLSEFNQIARFPSKRDKPEGRLLSYREKQILRLVAKGSSSKEIAEQLTVSPNTVKSHMRNIMEKLHIHNRLQAVAYALQEGLTEENGDTILNSQSP